MKVKALKVIPDERGSLMEMMSVNTLVRHTSRLVSATRLMIGDNSEVHLG